MLYLWNIRRVNLQFEMQDGKLFIEKSGVMRTARLLSKGDVFIPL
jgi:2-methylaconitate cis-trans-isomerase PrpF